MQPSLLVSLTLPASSSFHLHQAHSFECRRPLLEPQVQTNAGMGYTQVGVLGIGHLPQPAYLNGNKQAVFYSVCLEVGERS